jgi:putative DNA primase/helicase
MPLDYQSPLASADRAWTTPAPAGDGEGVRVVLTRASAIKPEPIRWLWNGWLARGKLHMLAGAPGTGKTTIALAFAATVSRGGPWPDGTYAKPADVIIWSGEDDPADGIIPRLTASGADLDRINIVSATSDRGKVRPFDPAADLRHLVDVAKATRPALLILDPIVSAIAGDSHKNAEVRRGLQPVVDLASDLGCAVVGITHFSKNTQGRDPVERLNGSLAFGALARLIMVTGRSIKEDVPRRLVRAKSNIGPDGDGFSYDLERSELPTSDDGEAITGQTAAWGEALFGTARELLAEMEAPDSEDEDGLSPAVSQAVQFLRSTLATGPCRAADVKANAEAAGLSAKTLQRAREAIRVVVQRDGGTAGKGWWMWSLPIGEAEGTA